MKYFSKLAIIFLSLLLATSCVPHEYVSGESDVTIIASITAINDKIEVEVEKSNNGIVGTYHVNIGSGTVYLDRDGNSISLSSLKVGDKIEITYAGQVMLSYPPQISAKKIQLK